MNMGFLGVGLYHFSLYMICVGLAFYFMKTGRL